MQLYSIRGGNKTDLENKNYTIGVGISLGNKWFSAENIVEAVKWSLQYSKDKVIVYVADSIHAINLEVRNRISFEKALEKAHAQGDQILNEVKSYIDREFSKEDADKIVFVKWDEIVNDVYTKKLEYLKSLYAQNADFKKTIQTIVKGFTSKEKRVFSEEDINRLGDYIIAELPEVLNRVLMKGVVCDAYTYPFDGELAKLAEEIQKGLIFPEIKEHIVDTEPKVFLEVR